MGFAAFIGNSGSNMAGLAVKNERRKQALIDQGTQMINSIYGGGTVPSYETAAGVYDPSKQYYTYAPQSGYSEFHTNKNDVPGGSGNLGGGHTASGINGTIAGFVGGGLGGLLGDNTETPKGQRLLKNGKLFTAGPSKTYTGFTPQFFANRAGAYERYALPQLGKQYNDASASIDYGLADRGLYDSSAGNVARSSLTRENAAQVQNVADVGRSQADDLKTSVENSRQNALAQLYQTADPQGASATALNSAASFQTPSAFQPIGEAFANLASQYAINNQLSYYNQPQYSTQQGYGNSPVNAGALPKV